jgi:hypothetical protein
MSQLRLDKGKHRGKPRLAKWKAEFRRRLAISFIREHRIVRQDLLAPLPVDATDPRKEFRLIRDVCGECLTTILSQHEAETCLTLFPLSRWAVVCGWTDCWGRAFNAPPLPAQFASLRDTPRRFRLLEPVKIGLGRYLVHEYQGLRIQFSRIQTRLFT